MEKPAKGEIKNWLVSAAHERQRLGLAKSEYEALTPFEISCELEARELLDRAERFRLEVLDIHLARISLILNGYQFPGLKSIDDCRLFKPEMRAKPAKKDGGKLSVAFALKHKREAEEFKRKRDKIRKKRALITG